MAKTALKSAPSPAPDKPSLKVASDSTKAEAKPAGRSKRKWLLIALALILVAGAAAGGFWWYQQRSDAPAGQPPKPAAGKPPIFVNLEPFTVNLQAESTDHYLQMSIVYQIKDDAAGETMKVYLPVIRNKILFLLSSKHASDLASPDGKTKLVAELLEVVRASIPGPDPDRGIVAAYLGAFVIQ